jgi:hypothetical protein
MASEKRRLHMRLDLSKLSDGELCHIFGTILTRPGSDWPTQQEHDEMLAINAEYERRGRVLYLSSERKRA